VKFFARIRPTGGHSGEKVGKGSKPDKKQTDEEFTYNEMYPSSLEDHPGCHHASNSERNQLFHLFKLDRPESVIMGKVICEEAAMKILLRNSPEAHWQKLEPFAFGGPDGEKKLENLLEKSPDLLTKEGGKPILFFKAQVALGNNAVDLLGVDADGMVVMVECKLEANREARRMVVGQILEYAGQLRSMSYRDFEKMLTGSPDLPLVDMVRQHVSEDAWSEENFRAGVEHGLERGDFRLVIAVNGMNDELKGIIEYLKTRGGVRLEALELQRFTDKSGVEALVPEIFGLPERTSGSSGARIIRVWNWADFAIDAAQKRLDNEQIKAIKEFHDKLLTELRAEIKWGTGTTFGWFGPKWQFCSAAVLGVSSYGKLSFSFGSLGKSDIERAFRERLRQLAIDKLGLPVPEDFEKRYPSYEFDWSQKAGLLLESLKAILP
jgi:hypothetical protein